MPKLISINYEQARAEHFKALMKKMQRKIDYWQYRGNYSLRPTDELSRANIECSEAGMQYNFYKDALEALENQPKWISVEERLPEVGDLVLVIANGKPKENVELINACLIASFWGDEGWIADGFDGWDKLKVTHWMPLPSTEGIE